MAGLAEVAHSHGVPLVVDEAWGAHLAFHEDLPAHALSLGADLVISSTHKIVGSLTQSAIVHLGPTERLDEDVVDRAVTLVESTSPNSLLLGSLDAARRLAVTRGRELLDETLAAMAADPRRRCARSAGLDVLDERLAGAPGVHGYDPLRLAIDVRGTGASGYDLARILREARRREPRARGRERDRRVFGMGEPARAAGRAAGGRAPPRARGAWRRGDRKRESFAPPPPWGELRVAPRDAFLAPQEVVPPPTPWPDRRRVARRLPAGYPNVLPGERLRGDAGPTSRSAIDHGGSLRGASDRQLRTVRVVAG